MKIIRSWWRARRLSRQAAAYVAAHPVPAKGPTRVWVAAFLEAVDPWGDHPQAPAVAALLRAAKLD